MELHRLRLGRFTATYLGQMLLLGPTDLVPKVGLWLTLTSYK